MSHHIDVSSFSVCYFILYSLNEWHNLGMSVIDFNYKKPKSQMQSASHCPPTSECATAEPSSVVAEHQTSAVAWSL